MTALDLIEKRIEAAIRELVDIDMTLAQATGNVTIGLTKLRDLSDSLKANAAKAVHSPTVTDRARKMWVQVVQKGQKIADVAKAHGVSVSTVRRSLDTVTDNQLKIRRVLDS